MSPQHPAHGASCGNPPKLARGEATQQSGLSEPTRGYEARGYLLRGQYKPHDIAATTAQRDAPTHQIAAHVAGAFGNEV